MTRHHRESPDLTRRARRAAFRVYRRVSAFVKNARPFLQSSHRGTAGFTLIEIAFACEVIMLLSLISFNETRSLKEHAKVAACLQYQVVVQRALWGDYALTGDFPDDLGPVLARLPQCSIGNNFAYKGGLADGLSGDYYLRCQHDHSYVAVMFVDSGSYLPPKAIYNLASARGNI